MREITLSEISLGLQPAEGRNALTFREKIETAKLLDRLGVQVIELGRMSGSVADNLLIKSVAAGVKSAAVAVCAEPGTDMDAVWEALKNAPAARLQVAAAVSVARMEYVYHKKPADMLDTAVSAIKEMKAFGGSVELIAEDATRSDAGYLASMIKAAVEAGADVITLCDSAGVMLPDEFSEFIRGLYANVPELSGVKLAVSCSNALNVADAVSAAAVAEGVSEIKVTALASDAPALEGVARIISAKSDRLGACCRVDSTEIKRVIGQIKRLCSGSRTSGSPFEDGVRSRKADTGFTANDDMNAVMRGAEELGYDLEDSDKLIIWEKFRNIAKRKELVSLDELDAIIASEAMQVPAAYTLENYIVTTGNMVDVMAHVKLKRDGEVLDGISLGDGPIDAAFLAIEKITGHHYELDDFQIQSITEGREAMGQTIVKLRSSGKIYAGRGISTDIIGSGVAAYINALNKIIYEEENR